MGSNLQVRVGHITILLLRNDVCFDGTSEIVNAPVVQSSTSLGTSFVPGQYYAFTLLRSNKGVANIASGATVQSRKTAVFGDTGVTTIICIATSSQIKTDAAANPISAFTVQ